MIDKRKFLKLLGFSYLLFLALPYRVLSSATKKIINPNLSKAQKNIMFNEGTDMMLKPAQYGYSNIPNLPDLSIYASKFMISLNKDTIKEKYQ